MGNYSYEFGQKVDFSNYSGLVVATANPEVTRLLQPANASVIADTRLGRRRLRDLSDTNLNVPALPLVTGEAVH